MGHWDTELSFCDKDYTGYPIYLVNLTDNSIQMGGHMVDEGELHAFQGMDGEINEGTVVLEQLNNKEYSVWLEHSSFMLNLV